jgi:GNAT superfamily N-acetyltransferase
MSGSERQRGVEISRATADEAASIASVLHEAFVEYQPLYTAEAFAITTPSPAEIEQRWNEGPVWSVVKDGSLVGTVAAVAKGDAFCIRSMAVLPSARGQGIGKMLLAEVESFARAGGFQRMLLRTSLFSMTRSDCINASVSNGPVKGRTTWLERRCSQWKRQFGKGGGKRGAGSGVSQLSVI